MKNQDKNILFDENSQVKIFKKKDFIQRQGDTSVFAYYIKSGLLRSYTIDEKGKEHIFMFAPEGWLIADIDAQAFKQPTMLFIDCIEDSEVVVIERSEFLNSSLTIEQLKETAHLMTRRAAILQRRVIMLMSATAKERYNNFLETYPELPNRVPQRLIASYLGITPEALSKIRGEIARTK